MARMVDAALRIMLVNAADRAKKDLTVSVQRMAELTAELARDTIV